MPSTSTASSTPSRRTPSPPSPNCTGSWLRNVVIPTSSLRWQSSPSSMGRRPRSGSTIWQLLCTPMPSCFRREPAWPRDGSTPACALPSDLYNWALTSAFASEDGVGGPPARRDVQTALWANRSGLRSRRRACRRSRALWVHSQFGTQSSRSGDAVSHGGPRRPACCAPRNSSTPRNRAGIWWPRGSKSR